MSIRTWVIDNGIKLAGTVKNGLGLGTATAIGEAPAATTIMGLSVSAFGALVLGVAGLGVYGWTQYQPATDPITPTAKVSNWDKDQAYEDDEREAEKKRAAESAKHDDFFACWITIGNRRVLSVRSAEYFGPNAKPLYANQVRHGGVKRVKVTRVVPIGEGHQTPGNATLELLEVIDRSTLRKPPLAAGQVARLKGSDQWVTVDDWGAVVFGELRGKCS